MNKINKKKVRVSIFFDGRNFYHSTRNLEEKGYKVDFKEIVNDLVGDRELVNVFYYNSLLDKKYNLEKYEKHNKFLDSIRSIPKFKVVLCDWRKIIKKDGSVRYDTKGDDVCLAHDLLLGAFDNLYDIAVLISGDADFIPVIKTLQRRFKKKIENGFFRRTSSYKLRRECDCSINLNMVIGKLIEKKQIPKV